MISQVISDVPYMIANVMQHARADANWRKANGIMPDYYELRRDVVFLNGMCFAAFYSAGGFDEGVNEARDAFTAARNELNFLFGRYQERT